MAFSSLSHGQDLVGQLIGLDAPRFDPYNESTYKDRADLVSSRDSRSFRMVEELKSRAKRYRRRYFDNNWATYYRAFIGMQWPMAGLPRWRSRVVSNYVFKIIEKTASMITDQRPKIYLMPPNESQAPYVDVLQACVDFIWESQNMDLKLVDFIKAGLIYGTSWMKPYWDPRLHDGKGDVQIDVANPFEVWIDPNPNPQYIIWEENISALEALRRFPHLSDKIIASAAMSSRESKEQIFHGAGSFEMFDDLLLRSPVQYDQINRDVPWVGPTADMGGANENLTLTEVFMFDYATEKDKDTGASIPKFDRNTRLLQFVGPFLHYDGPTPYAWSGFPWVQWKDISLPNEPYGISTVSQLWSIQRELNKRRAQMIDYATYMSNPLWIIDEMSMRDTAQLTTAPGLIVKKLAGTEVRREAPPAMPPSMFQMVELAVKDLIEISGLETPTGKNVAARSGMAMEAIQEAATGLVRLKVRALEAALRQMGKIIIKLVQQYYTEPRILRIMRSPDKIDFVEFNGGAIRGDWDLKIGAGSTLPISKMARFGQALQLFQAGAIDLQSLLEMADWPDKEAVLKRKALESQAQQKFELEMAMMRQAMKKQAAGSRGTKMKGARAQGPAPLAVDQQSGLYL